MAEVSARKRIWGWWFFDWASQPYHTVLLTFIFGPFFASVAANHYLSTGMESEAAKAAASTTWSIGLTLIGLVIAFGAPVLGAMADTAGRRIPWIVGFSVMYVVGAAMLWTTDPSGGNMWWVLFAFGFGFVGAEYALIFVNSQLPGLTNDEEVGKVSGSGFAFGYVGGLLALAVVLVFFVEQPNGKTLVGFDPVFGLNAEEREGTRIVGPFAALWYIVFMIPYFLWVREVKVPKKNKGFSDAMALLKRSLIKVTKRPSLAAYLGSSMFYRDALNGLYGFGGVYAGLVLEWNIVLIGVFGIVSGLASALFSWLGGKADRRFGPKPVIIMAIWVLLLVCVVVVNMSRTSFFGVTLAETSKLPDIMFFVCGMLLGGMGGILQAASRTLMVRHTDPEAPTESFGLYGLSGRATAFIAPMLIGAVTAWSGSTRIGVSPLIGLFLLGLILLRWVNPQGDQGEWADPSQS
ncbi:MFS transporter, UMF1 family [Shimia gijangensis]|uniref:MFS transporter, UMF1 family n=1 Tax=Shimia gijangensis TaxID=1470563 RepID=A0A1M6RRJ0_9RHOB|nr:MFS transporter [Shimia gijangensis]SHK35065.1 MFS transporter, UMF1 family [Shimia gijangensis]